jgi:hypothetical protein
VDNGPAAKTRDAGVDNLSLSRIGRPARLATQRAEAKAFKIFGVLPKGEWASQRKHQQKERVTSHFHCLPLKAHVVDLGLIFCSLRPSEAQKRIFVRHHKNDFFEAAMQKMANGKIRDICGRLRAGY